MKESPTQNETIADGTINIAIRLGKIVIFNARWYECLVCVCVVVAGASAEDFSAINN